MSLHTQYRPKSFNEVIGQDETVASLKHVIRDKRARCFIFTGPSGVGKTTLARILANSFADGKATAANVEEIDAASNSGADAMRAVVNRAFYKAVGASPVKCIIVDEVHRLSSSAWTILLKPIEEPPKHVLWCLCTTDAGKIPKTIQTRCLRYDLKPVDEVLIFELLLKVVEKEGIEISEDILEAIAEGAGGSPRQALVFLESCLYAETIGEARAIMRAAGQSKEAIDLARFLLKPQGRSWTEAMKYVRAMNGADPEGVRLTICNYLGAALLNTNGEQKARMLLAILECFAEPYNASEKLAPLLRSIGLTLGLDQ